MDFLPANLSHRARAASSDDADERLRIRITNGLITAVSLGILAILLECTGHEAGVKNPTTTWLPTISAYLASAGTAAAVFGAAIGSGGVLGFLFGVPNRPRGQVNNIQARNVAVSSGKDATSVGLETNTSAAEPDQDASSDAEGLQTSKGSDPSQTDAPASTPANAAGGYQSNLEQVADWVTKLLLGGGLTQLQNIPPKIWQWSRALAYGIIGPFQGADQVVQAQQSFAAGLLVYGFLLGFFGGFLITKLQLGKAIASSPVD